MAYPSKVQISILFAICEEWDNRNRLKPSCVGKEIDGTSKRLVLVEECREVAVAVLNRSDLVFNGMSRADLRRELISLATMSLVWFECLDTMQIEMIRRG